MARAPGVRFDGRVLDRTLISIAVALALAVPACSSGGEPVPDILDRYLRALTTGDLSEAYELTNLEQIIGSNPTAALTLEHFEAFYGRNPLERYEVRDVTRLDQRSIANADRPGVPFFVVDLTLHFQGGSSEETFQIEGEVLPVVQLEPTFFSVRLPGKDTSGIAVDGVPVQPGASETGYISIIVLPGRHDLSVGDRRVTFLTDPLTVLNGEARVTTDPVAIEFF